MNKITNLTNKNKKTLREFYNRSEGKNYKTISKIARLWSATSEDTYEILRELYNQAIDDKKNIFKKSIEDRFKEFEYRKLILHKIETTLDYPKSIFHIEDHTFSYLIDDVKVFGELNSNQYENLVNRAIYKLYNKLISYTSPNTYFRLLLKSNKGHSLASTELSSFGEVTIEDFVRKFLSYYERDDLFNGEFTVQLRRIPSGGMLEKSDIPIFLQKPKGIDIIYNDDGLCGQRCLVLADAKNPNDKYNIKKLPKMWDKKTLLLCDEINIKNEMSFIDFDLWANLRKKQVIILSDMFQVVYTTEIEYPVKIYIYYDCKIKHYHYIHNVNAGTNDVCRNSKWCSSCNKSFRFDNGSFATHKCIELSCYFCKEVFKTVELKEAHFNTCNWVHCSVCNCVCPSKICVEKHEISCKGLRKRCDTCKTYIDKKHFDKHICGEIYCSVCDVYHQDENHRCFIKPLKKKDDETHISNNNDIWVYDFESKFDDNHIHIVNKCIAMKLYSDETFVCDTIKEFVDFVLKKKQTTFIAHNGKAYDTWLVHKYLIKETNKRPNKLILAGQKIMYMRVNSIRFIDSLNHIAQALHTFPKTFGLKEMKKGFFPYLFNTDENKNYVGKIPDIKHFNPDSMSEDKREEFFEWYKLQTGVYDFKKELYEYCLSDVMILKQAMEIYIKDGISLNGINPIDSPTIASYAMKVYRTNFMEDKKICVLTKKEFDFIRRGFFGGRTEVFQLHATVTDEDIKNGKHIKYQDICSLYPTVQYFDYLPSGIPKWDGEYVGDMKSYLENHFGYIECDIECPNIHIPLLGEKKDGKLIFDLKDKNNCVYSSVELLKALELGYTITKIHNTLSFDKCDNMFKGYVQTFLKIKTEASGFDGDNLDDYIERYYKHCGVKLDKEKIKPNKGMKLLAKILLNSLWGKFGQKDDLPTVEYITKPDKWFKLLKKHIDGDIELKNETQIDDNTLYVQYISKETKTSSLNTTNLGLAGFVTAQARLRLYKELQNINERVIYCDTDSIIYKYDVTKYNIPEGDLLGEWECECEEKSRQKLTPIIEVLASAPKSYGYRCQNGYTDIKCKGIGLNYNNGKKFTHESLKDLIYGAVNEIETDKLEFIKKNGVIKSEETKKIIKFDRATFKRIINKDFTTSPYKN